MLDLMMIGILIVSFLGVKLFADFCEKQIETKNH